MAEIHVTAKGPDLFEVEVREGSSSTTHSVSVSAAELQRFGGGASGQELVRESFRFLLEREPKESILRRFELSVIARYFSEYPREILRRLGR